jgi:CDI immunity proteins
MMENLSIRQIEQSLGIADTLPEPSSALEKWYASVRDKRVEDFGIRDLCIACRQNLYPEHVVPVALRKLANDPLIGHIYDGELLLSLRGVPRAYWTSHPKLAEEVKAIFNSVQGRLGEEFKLFAEELIAAIEPAVPD